jgi:inosine-uridine nucleoside N-ribohydrolase
MSFPLVLVLSALAAERRPVVVTTDCGASFDDQWAIVHLAASPAVALRGLVGSLAPGLEEPSAETTAREAGAWLDRAGVKPRPPVFAGSSKPLDDLGKPRISAGATFLIEQSRRHSARDRLTVIVIGPATDVASALLIEPSVAERITIVAMGFDAWPGGGDVWNVKHDVKAWQVVLESEVPLVVGDAFVTQRDLVLSVERATTLYGAAREPGPSLVGLLDTWVRGKPKFAEAITGRRDAGPVWDEVSTACLLGLIKTETHPRPRLRDDLTFDHTGARGTIEWVTAIDAAALWADLASRLPAAAQ